MAVVAVTGGPGAPGATTTALALLLSWPLQPGRRVLLAECDPDGGAVLAGALEGRIEAVYGLRNLAVADRRGLLAQSMWEQLVDLSPEGTADRLLLPGLTDPAQASGLAYTWEPLADTFQALDGQGYDVIVDLGRSGAAGPGAVLARRADVVVATVRTTLRGLSAARPRLTALRDDLENAGSGADALGLLPIAEGPYPLAEAARELGVSALGLLPFAPRTAKVLSDGGDTADRRFVRSELMRTVRSAADRIQEVAARRRQRLAPQPQPYQQQPVPQPPAPQPIPQPQSGQQPQYGQPGPVPGPVLGPVAPRQPWAPAPEPHPLAFPQHIAPPAVPQPPAPASFPPPPPDRRQPQNGYGEVLRAR
ncbi:cellulose biosynthesis protein BcsQ [Streptomyces sp. TLI_235]|nr:hypothetical protein [Streptomyces sp. TLI_235]PBC76612.1 cellulose biosynthesis protein BcsQ [Streptomyces sp. TLI_235]